MKKQTKIFVVLCVISVLLFISLNIFFPYDGFYYSLEICETSFQKSLSNGEIVLKCDADDIIFEAWQNESDELYITKIMLKDSLFKTKYKVTFSKGYSIEKALDYYKHNENIMWTSAPEINTSSQSDVFSWCITDENSDVKNISDTYVTITCNGEKCRLFYKIISQQ